MYRKIFAVLLVLMITSFSSAQNDVEWKRFTSPEGRFTVLLPQSPELSNETITADNGDKGILYSVQTQLNDTKGSGFVIFMIHYGDLAADAQATNEVCDGDIKPKPPATLLHNEKITFSGYPGCEQELLSGDIIVHSRIIMVGRRLYQVMYVMPKDTDPAFVSRNAAKYFASFKLDLPQ